MRLFGREFELVRYHTEPNLERSGVIMLIVCGLLLTTTTVSGFVGRQREIEDTNKRNLVESVITALDLWYRDSADFLETRKYPVARCSNDLNSFDYEYTLRGELTGVKSLARSHSYIAPSAFPTDPLGSYGRDFATSFSCRQALPIEEQSQNRYFDGFQSCQFDINNTKNCFLYTSTLTGDSYKLSYWSPYYNKYIIYTKFRTNELRVSLY